MRWLSWALAMIPFLFVVQTLLVGLSGATQSETGESVRSLIFRAQWVTVLSWLIHPLSEASAVGAIQVGYCCSDVISKFGVGFIIYGITSAKSAQDEGEGLIPK